MIFYHIIIIQWYIIVTIYARILQRHVKVKNEAVPLLEIWLSNLKKSTFYSISSCI